jgi:hypothetical protein
MQVTDISFSKFKTNHGSDEGIVCLGCGGDLQEWINGITEHLNEEDIAKGSPEDLWKNIYRLETTGGRIDLAFVSHNLLDGFNVGKMAMWRMRLGNCSWISDYFDNYASHF